VAGRVVKMPKCGECGAFEAESRWIGWGNCLNPKHRRMVRAESDACAEYVEPEGKMPLVEQLALAGRKALPILKRFYGPRYYEPYTCAAEMEDALARYQQEVGDG